MTKMVLIKNPRKWKESTRCLHHRIHKNFKRFLGMITYLSLFITSFSTFTVHLYRLLDKDVEFTWNDSYQSAFEMIKKMVCRDTTLWYFDIFASKALTPT